MLRVLGRPCYEAVVRRAQAHSSSNGVSAAMMIGGHTTMDHPDGTQDLAPQVDSLARGVCLYWTPRVRLMLCRKRRAGRPGLPVLVGAR